MSWPFIVSPRSRRLESNFDEREFRADAGSSPSWARCEMIDRFVAWAKDRLKETLDQKHSAFESCSTPIHSSTIASVSISTSISGEINFDTSTMLVAGRISLKNSP
jgi:hypothetical protein